MRKPSKLEQQLAELHGSPPADAVRRAVASKNGVTSGERADALAAAKALATFNDDPALCARIRAAAPRALRKDVDALLA